MINLYYANAYCSEDISNIENYAKAIADKKLSMAFKGMHWKVINGKRVWIKENI